MIDTKTIDALKTAFRLEISNPVVVKENEIIISLADGSKAKISAKQINT